MEKSVGSDVCPVSMIQETCIKKKKCNCFVGCSVYETGNMYVKINCFDVCPVSISQLLPHPQQLHELQ
jgi:hypothetical protein